jgi:hypothetical protein
MPGKEERLRKLHEEVKAAEAGAPPGPSPEKVEALRERVKQETEKRQLDRSGLFRLIAELAREKKEKR